MQVSIVSILAGLVAGGGALGAGLAFGLSLSAGFAGVCAALGVTVGVILLVSARADFSARCGLPADEFFADSFTSAADKAA